MRPNGESMSDSRNDQIYIYIYISAYSRAVVYIHVVDMAI